MLKHIKLAFAAFLIALAVVNVYNIDALFYLPTP